MGSRCVWFMVFDGDITTRWCGINNIWWPHSTHQGFLVKLCEGGGWHKHCQWQNTWQYLLIVYLGSFPLCYDWQNNFYFVKRLTSASVEDLVMVIVPVSAMEGQAITQTRAQGVRMVEVEKQSCRDGDGWWWMSCDPPDTCGIIQTMCPHCYNQGNQTHHM